LSTTSIYRKRVTPLPLNFIAMSGIARMATRGSTARQRTVSESTARNTGESSASARQNEKEARIDSEVTPGDTEDVVANQRAFIQELVERQAAMQDEMAEQRASMQAEMAEQRALMQAQLEAIESRQPPANLNVLPVPPLAPAAQSNLFKMRDPAPFCGGPAELEQFLRQIRMNFESHRHQFPRGDPDKVQYAMGLFRTWLEHPDESQGKSKVTHPAEWGNQLGLNPSASLNNWGRFEKRLRVVYGDRDRQLNAALVAVGEITQGYHDSDESVRDFESRTRSNWRDSGWHMNEEDDDSAESRILYDLAWAGLRPAIRMRIRPFAGKNGRFDTLEKLFEKAHEVEIKPNRERRAQQPASPAEKKHGNSGGNSGGNNGGNSGGNNGGKDRRKRPYHDTPWQSYTPTTPSHTYSHSNLPPAPWLDRETRDKRKEKGLCYRCRGDHKAFHCPKYSRIDIPPTRKNEDRQDRDKRQEPADSTQQAKN
jgi:hypothetical protein